MKVWPQFFNEMGQGNENSFGLDELPSFVIGEKFQKATFGN